VAEIIVALDVESVEDALHLVDGLEGLRWAKIGSVLFARGGPRVVRALRDRGIEVFLDLKWHDIPSTVAGAAAAAAELGVALVTVHALGGPAMIEAAVAAAGEARVAAVSVLTSHSAAVYWDTVGRPHSDLRAEVVRLARLGVKAGARAIVASPLEVMAVRRAVGAAPWIVVPGIRSPGAAADDQWRTATPQEVVGAGATHLVVGRPITRAKTPRAVYEGLCKAASGT
jgi:orotidine-5'-phosphate decarboxylase